LTENKEIINTLNANILDLQNKFDLLSKENDDAKIELKELSEKSEISNSNADKGIYLIIYFVIIIILLLLLLF
jgi:hypothetical protein